MSQAPAFNTVFLSTRDLKQRVRTYDVNNPYELSVAPRSTPMDESALNSQTETNLFGNRVKTDLYAPASYEGVLGTVSGIDVPREGLTTLRLEDLQIDEACASFDYIELTNENAGFDVTFLMNNGGNIYRITYEITGFMDAFRTANYLEFPKVDLMWPLTIERSWYIEDIQSMNDRVHTNNLLTRINHYLQNLPDDYKPRVNTIPDTVDQRTRNVMLMDSIDTVRKLMFQVLTQVQDTIGAVEVDGRTDRPCPLVAYLENCPKVAYYTRQLHISFSRFRTLGKYMARSRMEPLVLNVELANRSKLFSSDWEFCPLSYRDLKIDVVQPYRSASRGRVLRVLFQSDASNANQEFTAKSSLNDMETDWANTVALLYVSDQNTYTIKTMPHTLTPGSRLSAFQLSIVNEYGDIIHTPNHFHTVLSLSNATNLRNPYV